MYGILILNIGIYTLHHSKHCVKHADVTMLR